MKTLVSVLISFFFFTSIFPQIPGKIIWEFQTNVTFGISSPAIADDGTIYFGSQDSCLYAINPDGTQKWKFQSNGSIESSPILGSDDEIYFSSSDDKLHSLNPDGTQKWEISVDSDFSTTIGKNGTIYVVNPIDYRDYDGWLIAINSDGTKKWEFEFGSEKKIRPTVGMDGTIYIGEYITCEECSEGRGLFAFNPDGTQKWLFSNHNIENSPALDKDGTIYFSNSASFSWDEDNFFAINPDGTLKWSYHGGDLSTHNKFTSPIIGADGTIYTGSKLGKDSNYSYKLLALNNNGSVKWEIPIESEITPAIIGKSGNIYAIKSSNKFIAFNNDGLIKWEIQFDAGIGLPAISGDGTIYISSGGKLFAIENDNDGLANSPWPKFYKNNKNQNSSYSENYPRAIFAEDTIFSKDGNVTLDATQSYDPNGDTINYLWRVTEQPEGSNLKLTDSTSSKINVTIPSEIRGQFRFSLTVTNENLGYNTENVFVDFGAKWNLKIDGYVQTTPAIGDDGTIYFDGSCGNNIFAVNLDGKLKWKFPTEFCVWTSPAIGKDGTIYGGSRDGYLYAINSDGTCKWKYRIGEIRGDIAIDYDGIIYITGYNNFYAINPEGTLKWVFELENTFWNNASICLDGSISISNEKLLYNFNQEGKINWTFESNENLISEFPINGDGILYAGTPKYTSVYNNGTLYSINPDGTKNWEYSTEYNIYPTPVIDNDGTLYFGTSEPKIIAMNPDMSIKWEYIANAQSLLIGDDGTIYCRNFNNIIALDRNGKKKWEYKNKSNSWWGGDLAIDSEGIIYTGLEEGYLHAIYSDSKGLAKSPWPKLLGNKNNTSISYYIKADFSAVLDTTNGSFPPVVQFSDSSQGRVKNWFWDFGDGQTNTEKNPVHVYSNADSFLVTLITTGYFRTDTLQKIIDIKNLNITNIVNEKIYPAEFKLYENYPNPFNPQTNIEFDVKEKTTVKLRVYNIVGQLVTTLTDNMLDIGHYKYQFNGNNLASGIYFYKIEMGKYVSVKKMMLLK